ncbi:mono/diheme cytochrome c family protein [Rhodovulum iodosum]|uniref:Mono/diheme cytochrome c family protein n=1 Tax=Rhodovulum iodosum TaxID=68291 RepID=A0ABV3XSN6_9RHOB|nr:DUF1924 domain-containing protein [Rhodovulum robiginosum]RSK30667.1 DUF1924 domain-containing protein [Rhodovulum robiginosum]
MKTFTLAVLLLAGAAAPAVAQDTSPAKLIAGYEAAAGTAADPAAGKDLFLAEHGGGKPETPSCTTCHTADPRAGGQTRAGKAIDPLAPAANGQRMTDTGKVEKWFGRNCNSVLGRDCTAAEKANIIAWLASL